MSDTDNKDIEWTLHKGERYLIEIEPKEDIDAMEKGSILESIFGESAEDINVVKLWVIGSSEMFDDIMEKVEDFSEELKHLAEDFFKEYK